VGSIEGWKSGYHWVPRGGNGQQVSRGALRGGGESSSLRKGGGVTRLRKRVWRGPHSPFAGGQWGGGEGRVPVCQGAGKGGHGRLEGGGGKKV